MNNALAVVDIRAARVTAVLPFGLKNHNRPGNGLDASSDDGKVNIRPWPVWGAYLPDGIAAFPAHGRTFLATANEGDTRNDAIEVGDITLDPSVFPNASVLQDPTALGGLEVSTLRQDARPNAKGEYRRLVSFGARSIGIWNTSAQRIFDSGNRLERITADPALYPVGTNYFNTTDDENSFDKRSPRRGPQPLGIAVGRVGGRTYAFIGLEKQSGIIIGDVTDAPTGVPLGYASTRDFTQDPSNGGLWTRTSRSTARRVIWRRRASCSSRPSSARTSGPCWSSITTPAAARGCSRSCPRHPATAETAACVRDEPGRRPSRRLTVGEHPLLERACAAAIVVADREADAVHRAIVDTGPGFDQVSPGLRFAETPLCR